MSGGWTTDTPHPTSSLEGPPRPSSRSAWGSYQIIAFSLNHSACEILCEVSVFPSPAGLPKWSPAGLQSQMLKGLIFLEQDLWVWGPEIGLRTLTPVGDTLQYNYFPVFGLPTWGVWHFYMASLPLLSIWLWFFVHIFICRRAFWVCSSLFHGFSSADRCDLGVHVRGGEVRVFLLYHLDWPPRVVLLS